MSDEPRAYPRVGTVPGERGYAAFDICRSGQNGQGGKVILEWAHV